MTDRDTDTETVYLDHNAMTPVRPEVIDVMADALRRYVANPSSHHHAGRAAREALDRFRLRLGELLDAAPMEGLGAYGPRTSQCKIIFTSGAVEANHLALLGVSSARVESQNAERRLIISGVEHSSVLEPAEHLMEHDWRLDTLPASSDGVVRTDLLEKWLTRETALVSVIAASHETGVIQPMSAIAAITHRYGVPLHSDASQFIGKRPFSFSASGADAISFTAQKFGGPPGVGCLIVRDDCPIRPIAWGGRQQYGLRPGTESVALAAGLVAALELRLAELETWAGRIGELRDRFELRLRKELPDIVIHSQNAERISNTSSIAFPGCVASDLQSQLDRAGIACSIGSACDAEDAEPSVTLRSMGVSDALARSSLRFSFGDGNTQPQIDDAVNRIVRVYTDRE